MELSLAVNDQNNELLKGKGTGYRQFKDLYSFETEKFIVQLQAFQIALPSWALGTGGTRFGRFAGTGEPGNLEEKLDDIALLNSLSRSCNAVSLHFPWDSVPDLGHAREYAHAKGLHFEAVNSNTFQDQAYKFGSLQHTDEAVRTKAIEHLLEVIDAGKILGSSSMTVWLADGSGFPGQLNFREAFERTLSSLQHVYSKMPHDWKMYIEYKPYEPNFYSTTVPDWGTSLLLANKLGSQAYTLVDLGHHLPGTNIEQIVATLLMEKKLGGFHFNDSKYGDDDLTTGSIDPYQLFLIFNELVHEFERMQIESSGSLSWMIDSSHNLKDPLEDLLQALEAIKIAYAQALLVDRDKLQLARQQNDVVTAQAVLQEAFRTDVRPLLAEARLRSGGAIDPISLYRSAGVRKHLTAARGFQVATGL